MSVSYDKQKNIHSCMICGKEFLNYHAAYMHIKRSHPTHPSMRAERENYTEDNVPSASLFGQHDAVRREPEYGEYIRSGPEHREPFRERESHEKEENDKTGVIIIFLVGLIIVGYLLYKMFIKDKLMAWGIEETDEAGHPYPVGSNIVPGVTQDGAYAVINPTGGQV